MFCIEKGHHSNQHISRMHRGAIGVSATTVHLVFVSKLVLVVLKVFEKGNTVTGIFGECIEVQLGCRPRQWICCGSRIRRYCLACGRSSGLGCGALVCLDAIGVGLYLCLYLSFLCYFPDKQSYYLTCARSLGRSAFVCLEAVSVGLSCLCVLTNKSYHCVSGGHCCLYLPCSPLIQIPKLNLYKPSNVNPVIVTA